MTSFYLRYIFSGAEVFPDDLSDNDSDEDDDEVGVYSVVVVYHLTIVAIGHGLFFWPFWY